MLTAAQVMSAGDKFLTPSIEYYKNVANQYKKTLSQLSINQPGGVKPETETERQTDGVTRNEAPYML